MKAVHCILLLVSALGTGIPFAKASAADIITGNSLNKNNNNNHASNYGKNDASHVQSHGLGDVEGHGPSSFGRKDYFVSDPPVMAMTKTFHKGVPGTYPNPHDAVHVSENNNFRNNDGLVEIDQGMVDTVYPDASISDCDEVIHRLTPDKTSNHEGEGIHEPATPTTPMLSPSASDETDHAPTPGTPNQASDSVSYGIVQGMTIPEAVEKFQASMDYLVQASVEKFQESLEESLASAKKDIHEKNNCTCTPSVGDSFPPNHFPSGKVNKAPASVPNKTETDPIYVPTSYPHGTKKDQENEVYLPEDIVDTTPTSPPSHTNQDDDSSGIDTPSSPPTNHTGHEHQEEDSDVGIDAPTPPPMNHANQNDDSSGLETPPSPPMNHTGHEHQEVDNDDGMNTPPPPPMNHTSHDDEDAINPPPPPPPQNNTSHDDEDAINPPPPPPQNNTSHDDDDGINNPPPPPRNYTSHDDEDAIDTPQLPPRNHTSSEQFEEVTPQDCWISWHIEHAIVCLFNLGLVVVAGSWLYAKRREMLNYFHGTNRMPQGGRRYTQQEISALANPLKEQWVQSMLFGLSIVVVGSLLWSVTYGGINIRFSCKEAPNPLPLRVLPTHNCTDIGFDVGHQLDLGQSALNKSFQNLELMENVASSCTAPIEGTFSVEWQKQTPVFGLTETYDSLHLTSSLPSLALVKGLNSVAIYQVSAGDKMTNLHAGDHGAIQSVELCFYCPAPPLDEFHIAMAEIFAREQTMAMVTLFALESLVNKIYIPESPGGEGDADPKVNLYSGWVVLICSFVSSLFTFLVSFFFWVRWFGASHTGAAVPIFPRARQPSDASATTVASLVLIKGSFSEDGSVSDLVADGMPPTALASSFLSC